jgi:hypothetical protein
MTRPRIPKNTTDALLQQAYAARNRAVAKELAVGDPTAARWALLEAADMDKYAAAYLEIAPGSVKVGSGGEMVPTSDIAEENAGLVDTIRSAPDMVTARASIARINLIAETGDLDLATDAADTIKARNSLEKMLAHQIASAHGLAMKLAAKSGQFLGKVTSWDPEGRQQISSIEASRLANSAARMMEAFNQGLLTLDRLRNGRRQVVTVQHVTVNPGGQAIVAGALKPRRSRRRGAKQN